MKRIYNTGLDTNQISLRVIVGTVGTAYTSVYLARSGGQQTKIAESSEDSGNIAETVIGPASQVRNSYLIILTSIELNANDIDLWEQQADNLVIRYHLNGGFSGYQVYNHDTDDTKLLPNGKILVTKPIELL